MIKIFETTLGSKKTFQVYFDGEYYNMVRTDFHGKIECNYGRSLTFYETQIFLLNLLEVE